MARPWSKHSIGSSAAARRSSTPAQQQQQQQQVLGGSQDTHKNISGKSIGRTAEQRKLKKAKEEQDPLLEEFLSVMAPRLRAKIWSNDELMPSSVKV